MYIFSNKLKKINTISLLILISTLFLIISCNTNQKFDANKWKKKGTDWWMTDVREVMVDDLIKTNTLIGLTKAGTINLLGKPKSTQSKELEYLIREKYGADIDPEYISILTIKFDTQGLAYFCKAERQ